VTLSSTILILLIVLALAGAYRMHRARRVERLRWWKALAEKHGLTLREPGEPHETEIEGDYRGVHIKAVLGGSHVGPSLDLATHVLATLPGAVPPGFWGCTHAYRDRLRRGFAGPPLLLDDTELAQRYTFRSSDTERTLEFLRDPEVKRLLLEAADNAVFVRVDSEAVTVEQRGVLAEELPGFVDLAARVAATLSEAYERPWAEFAKEHGLVFKGAGTRGDRILRGHLNGSRVQVQTGPLPENPEMCFTTIRVAIPVRLPVGFRVTPRLAGPQGRGAFLLDEPDLDAVLQVQGTNSTSIKALLRHPALREHLLAFYEVCPFTIIEGGAIVAGGPGLLAGDILQQVSAVQDLARSFRDVWALTQRRAARPTSDDAPEPPAPS
jgi:hypothetical protein